MKIPTLLHISDLHFGFIHKEIAETARREFVTDLRNLNPKPNFIIVSGDLSEFGLESELKDAKTFLDEVAEICQLENKRHLIVVPGNHDLLKSIRRLFRPKRALLNYQKFFCENVWEFFEDYNLTIFGFNSNCVGRLSFTFDDGKIGRSQLASLGEEYIRLKQSLKERNLDDQFIRSLKIAVLHHHSVPTPHTQMQNFLILRDAGDFLQRVTSYNFDLILHGHQHFPFHALLSYPAPIDPRRELLIVGAGTLSSRKTKPAGFNHYSIITIDTRYSEDVPVTINWRTNHAGRFDDYRSFELFLRRREIKMATIINTIAEAIGYKRLKLISTTKINYDGSCLDSTRVRIKAMVDRLKRVHIVMMPEHPVTSEIEFQVHYKDCENLIPSLRPDAQGNYFIEFEPYLSIHREAEFEVIVHYKEPVFRMNLDELIEFRKQHPYPIAGLDQEAVSHTVTIPLEYLELTVEFPEGFQFSNAQCAVFRDQLGIPHALETERFESGFKKEKGTLSVSLKDPVLGLIYALLWKPPKTR
jgi:predicted MPP superfamily phosphohydrolase